MSFEKLANVLFDYVIDIAGVEDTCVYLVYQDITEEELEFLGFDKEIIDIASQRVLKGGDNHHA